MPPLTYMLGPWLKDPEAGRGLSLAERSEILLELIDMLPNVHSFSQACHYSMTDWLPFYWRGFRQATRYTYVLPDLTDLDAIWDGFDHRLRRVIRKAQTKLQVVDDLGFDVFLRVRNLSYVRQGIEPTHISAPEFLRGVDAACAAHNARKIFFAVDSQDRVHGVVYVVWTRFAAYYLLGGADPDLRSSGAQSLLLWKAIQFSQGVAQTFDFEMALQSLTLERFYRLFGGRLTPYYLVDKRVPLCWGCHHLRHNAVHRLDFPLYNRVVSRAGRWLHRTA